MSKKPINDSSAWTRVGVHTLSVFDQVLPESLFEELREFVQEEGARQSGRVQTYWHPLTTPICAAEQAVTVLTEKIQSLIPSLPIVGAEWWVQHRDLAELGHPLHLDVDDQLYLDQGVLRRPTIGSVLYFDRSEDLGGNFIVYSSSAARTPIYVPSEPNRLVVFASGHLLHGVTDSQGNIVEERPHGEQKKKFRISMPINWWDAETANAKRYQLPKE